MSFCVIKRSELRRGFIKASMGRYGVALVAGRRISRTERRTENRAATLSLIADDSSHIELL